MADKNNIRRRGRICAAMAADATVHRRCYHWTFANHPRFIKQQMQIKERLNISAKLIHPAAWSLQQLMYLLFL